MITLLKNIILKITYIFIIIYLLIFIPVLWGYHPLVIVSGSMEPILKVGGLMYYEKIDLNDFKTGDILVYRTKEHIVSHRVVKKLNSSFITKGDVNDIVDGEVYNQNVLGRGTNFSIPLLGYFADFIYYHKFILIIIFGLMIIDQMIYKDRERKKFNELYS